MLSANALQSACSVRYGGVNFLQHLSCFFARLCFVVYSLDLFARFVDHSHRLLLHVGYKLIDLFLPADELSAATLRLFVRLRRRSLLPLFSCVSGFDRSVQCEQVRLPGNFHHHHRDITDLMSMLFQLRTEMSIVLLLVIRNMYHAIR